MIVVPLTPELIRQHWDTIVPLDALVPGSPWTVENYCMDAPGKWDCSFAVLDSVGELVAVRVASLKLPAVHLHRVAVSPRYQHLGLGRNLVYRAIRSGLALGATSVSALRDKDNAVVSTLFRSLGFEESAYDERLVRMVAPIQVGLRRSQRIVVAHQPNLCPWLGYLHKVAHSDSLILLDTVQYVSREYQNRTSVLLGGTPVKITVPLKKAPRDSLIVSMELAEPGWGAKALATLRHCYGKSLFFDQIFPLLEAAWLPPATHLVELNQRLLQALLDLLQLKVRLFLASELGVTTVNPTRRLSELVQTVGGSHYVSGHTGRQYMDLSVFSEAGVEILWQDQNFSRVTYPQRGVTSFIPGLASLDSLFNIGPAAVRELLTMSL